MPWVGLGAFLSPVGQETESAVRWALELGYRHIDTASAYNADRGLDSCLKAFDESRRKLGLDQGKRIGPDPDNFNF